MNSLAPLFEELLRWQELWSSSILQRWPAVRPAFPREWMEAVMALSAEEQRQLDDEVLPASLPTSLLRVMEVLHDSCAIPVWDQELAIGSLYQQGLNQKKQHEIRRLLPFLAELVQEGKLTRGLDIGGGMGHLARVCVQELGLRFSSIDRDSRLQEKGRKLGKTIRSFPAERLDFVHAAFQDAPAQLSREKDLLSIGLHTCGPLALQHLEKVHDAAALINFGCCFDRLDPAAETNLSEAAKAHPLPWTKHALFLATRGRKGKTADEFRLMKRVNDYRFAAHLILKRLYPEEIFLSLGDAPKALYEGSFAAYLKDRVPMDIPDATLEKMYTEAQAEVAAIFAAHQIRSLFARPLEIALLMDRAFWMMEKGYDAGLLQFFDRSLSPRNIGLFIRRPNSSGH